MFALGAKVGLEEVPLNVRLVVGVSESLIVKGTAEVGVSTLVDWSGTELIMGGADEADDVVVILRLHPPANRPKSPGPSSTTYNDHAPFAEAPLKAPRLLSYGARGAGLG